MALAKQTDKQFKVRMPHEMHALLSQVADKNNRSINSEIVMRLRTALYGEENPESMRGLVNGVIKARVSADKKWAEENL